MRIILKEVSFFLDYYFPTYINLYTGEHLFEHEISEERMSTEQWIKLPLISDESIKKDFIYSVNNRNFRNQFNKKKFIKNFNEYFYYQINKFNFHHDWEEFKENALINYLKNWCEENQIEYQE
jgi:hypothetical protein